MQLCRVSGAQEAELNFISASLSPLNYSSRDGAPETTAMGDTGGAASKTQQGKHTELHMSDACYHKNESYM